MYLGNDYDQGPYVVIIPSGKNDVTFSVSITDDNIHEESETFNLTIDGSSLPNGVTSIDRATVIIMDNDSKWLVVAYIVIGLSVFWLDISVFSISSFGPMCMTHHYQLLLAIYSIQEEPIFITHTTALSI